MSTPFFYSVAALAILAVVLVGWVVRHPTRTAGRARKALGFLGFFILPVLVTGLGTTGHLEQSKSTEFCLSCHVMEPYGDSLRIDDHGCRTVTYCATH